MADEFHLWQELRSWWREQRERRGRWGALRLLAGELFDLLRDSTPERLRARYGDIEYDFEAAVETTSANVGCRSRLRGMLAGSQYQPCDPILFRDTLNALPIEPREFSFVDIGSGKGRALLLAAEQPFRRILGIERLPELHLVAERNIRDFCRDRQCSCTIESTCGDGRDFVFPAGPLVVFLFNPLPEAALRAVVANLEQSLAAEPRRIYVLYHNPVLEHVLAGRAGLRRISGDLQYAIYSNAP